LAGWTGYALSDDESGVVTDPRTLARRRATTPMSNPRYHGGKNIVAAVLRRELLDT
jgi:hypothetical protein